MKNLKITFLILLTFLIATPDTFAQVNIQKSQNFIKKNLEKHFPSDQPGITLIVTQGDKVIFEGAAGMADLELNIPMEANHVLRLGSITKQFTAIAILMLAEQGKLNIQDDLTKFLPNYPTLGKKITIEHLLTHTSGIQSYTSIPGFMNDIRDDMTTSELIDSFKDKKMNFEPGEEFRYNNSGYILLGVIIEKASGMTYEDFIEKNIFEKLRMKNSYYDNAGQIIPRRASGYERDNGEFVNAPYLSMTIPYAAGSLASTVNDLWKWNQAVFSYKMVNKKSLDKAHTAFQLNNGEVTTYGYGWGIDHLYNTQIIEHSGGINGFSTNGIYIPKEEIFIAGFSNGKNPGTLTQKIAAYLIGEYPDLEKKSLTKEEMNDFVGIYEVENSKSKRTIRIKDDHLTSIRTGGELYNLYAFEKDKFFFENSLEIFEFKRNKEGKVVGILAHLTNGKKGKAIKTDEQIKERKEIQLDEKTLQLYVGEYEVQPGFELKFTLENKNLWVKPTGEPKFQLFAIGKNQFFLKAVDVQLEFIKEGSEFNKVNVNMGGNPVAGTRKK